MYIFSKMKIIILLLSLINGNQFSSLRALVVSGYKVSSFPIDKKRIIKLEQHYLYSWKASMHSCIKIQNIDNIFSLHKIACYIYSVKNTFHKAWKTFSLWVQYRPIALCNVLYKKWWAKIILFGEIKVLSLPIKSTQ